MKILLLDIESSPNTAHVWGLWQQNVGIKQIMESSYVLCWAAKWLDDKEIMFDLELNAKLDNRSVNEGFSGGEKKKNEIFQMAMLNPTLAILDETDSGLDIDALRIVANGVNKLRTKDNAYIIITHYQRLLDYIVPDFVHVMYDGRIVKSGSKELAIELEEKGYDWIKEEVEKMEL